MMPSLEYLAGLLDGGSTITIEKRRDSYYPNVAVTDANKVLTAVLNAAFPGGTVRPRRKRGGQTRDSFEVRWRYDAALAVISAVAPYLIAKQKVAMLVLGWKAVVRRNGQYSTAELEARDALIAEVRLANATGRLRRPSCPGNAGATAS